MSNLLKTSGAIHTTSSKNRSRKSYTIGFKRAAIAIYDSLGNNKSETCRRMHIPDASRKCLKNWIDNREIIFDPTNRVNSRKMYANRHKALFPLAEESLFKWFSDKRSKYIKVTGDMLQQQMLKEVISFYENDDNVNINKFLIYKFDIKFHNKFFY